MLIRACPQVQLVLGDSQEEGVLLHRKGDWDHPVQPLGVVDLKLGGEAIDLPAAHPGEEPKVLAAMEEDPSGIGEGGVACGNELIFSVEAPVQLRHTVDVVLAVGGEGHIEGAVHLCGGQGLYGAALQMIGPAQIVLEPLGEGGEVPTPVVLAVVHQKDEEQGHHCRQDGGDQPGALHLF